MNRFFNNFGNRIVKGTTKNIKTVSLEQAKELIGKKGRPPLRKENCFFEIVKVRNIEDIILAELEDGTIVNIEILKIMGSQLEST